MNLILNTELYREVDRFPQCFLSWKAQGNIQLWVRFEVFHLSPGLSLRPLTSWAAGGQCSSQRVFLTGSCPKGGLSSQVSILRKENFPRKRPQQSSQGPQVRRGLHSLTLAAREARKTIFSLGWALPSESTCVGLCSHSASSLRQPFRAQSILHMHTHTPPTFF